MTPVQKLTSTSAGNNIMYCLLVFPRNGVESLRRFLLDRCNFLKTGTGDTISYNGRDIARISSQYVSMYLCTLLKVTTCSKALFKDISKCNIFKVFTVLYYAADKFRGEAFLSSSETSGRCEKTGVVFWADVQCFWNHICRHSARDMEGMCSSLMNVALRLQLKLWLVLISIKRFSCAVVVPNRQ